MYLVDLVCADGHGFEGWYDNRAAFDAACDDGALVCPVCESPRVERKPSFRAVLRQRDGGSSSMARRQARAGDDGPAPMSETAPGASSSSSSTSTPPMPLEVQKALSRLIRYVKANTEDAGEHFASRALAMHKGDEAPAPIHGTSTPEERKLLAEEGVPFVGLPIPDIDQN